LNSCPPLDGSQAAGEQRDAAERLAAEAKHHCASLAAELQQVSLEQCISVETSAVPFRTV
jgi:hypothetical protein